MDASYLTLCGSAFGEPARYGIATRARAAYRAGFTGIGADSHEVNSDLVSVADRLPVPVTELEWFDLGKPDWKIARNILTMADALGTVTRVNVGMCEQSPMADVTLVTTLRRFADMAGQHGLTVAVEPVAFGASWQPDRVGNIIATADMPNAGFLWDTWQVGRAQMFGAVCDIPASMVTEVQLAGESPDTGNELADAMSRRLVDANALAMLANLHSHGYSGPVDTEITNALVRSHSADWAAFYSFFRVN